MIRLYTWSTPNGYKIPIMLEECGLEYDLIPVNLDAKEQLKPEFLALNPYHKIPVFVDADLKLFESGAILDYLAEKEGKFMPLKGAERAIVMQWLMFQMGNIGPMLGQAHHFRHNAPEKIPYAIDRYTNEAVRLYRVLDARLAQTEFLAGEYSIADMATYPWIRRHERHGQKLEDWPNIHRWYRTIESRPAVSTAYGKVNAVVDPIKAAAK